MAKDEIIIKTELEIARAKTNIKKLKGEMDGLDMRFTESKLKVKQLANEELKLAQGKRRLIQRNKELTLSQNKLGASTGAATSATLELGRTISDMPYGIRGVANNLSQFASQFSFMANSVDATTGKVAGFSGAIKNLGRAIKANAVLLLIQAVIAAFDYFAGSVSKAEKNIKSLYDTVTTGFVKVKKLEELNNIINDSNSSIGEQEEALKKLTKLGYKPANEELEDFIENQKKLVIVNAAIQAVESQLKEIYEKRLKLQSKFNREMKDFLRIQEEGVGGLEISKAVLEQLKLDKQDLDTKEKELSDEFNRLLRRSLKLTDAELDFKIKKPKKKERVSVATDLDFVNIGDDVKKMQKYLNAVAAAMNIDLKANPLSIAPILNMELSPETQAGIDAYNKKVVDLMSEKFKAEDFAKYADTAKEALSNISNFIDAQFDRQLVTENNRTNAMNEELNNRLLNENLSAKERANIQNQIAQNDEELRKKQNEIKKKAFNTNKAFQLAMAVADTSSSVLKAYGSQLVIGDPTSIFRAKIAASIAGAMGALQIATIASSKFQPDAASTPIRTAGGGGGGLGSRTFDFNLVGNNQNNQIAEAIGSQFDKPLKAYVVSKDVTNAQQLDANIKSSARFGG